MSTALANEAAYDRWAPSYPPLPHNPLMQAEQQALLALWPDVQGKHALDLACGTGRYARLLQERGAAPVVAADLSLGMLSHAQVDGLVRADMTALPFADAAFEAIVCGLAIGHAPSLDTWMQEVARVLAPGGVLLYSDFHAEAAAAGMSRSFTDGQQRKHTLLHQPWPLPAQRVAAASAGLVIEASHEVRVGRDLLGSAEFNARWSGLAVVLVVRARKPP